MRHWARAPFSLPIWFAQLHSTGIMTTPLIKMHLRKCRMCTYLECRRPRLVLARIFIWSNLNVENGRVLCVWRESSWGQIARGSRDWCYKYWAIKIVRTHTYLTYLLHHTIPTFKHLQVFLNTKQVKEGDSSLDSLIFLCLSSGRPICSFTWSNIASDEKTPSILSFYSSSS